MLYQIIYEIFENTVIALGMYQIVKIIFLGIISLIRVFRNGN